MTAVIFNQHIWNVAATPTTKLARQSAQCRVFTVASLRWSKVGLGAGWLRSNWHGNKSARGQVDLIITVSVSAGFAALGSVFTCVGRSREKHHSAEASPAKFRWERLKTTAHNSHGSSWSCCAICVGHDGAVYFQRVSSFKSSEISCRDSWEPESSGIIINTPRNTD